MVSVLFASVCLFFGALVLFRETKKVLNINSVRIIHIFGLMYSLTYGFLPAIIFYGYDLFGYEVKAVAGATIDYSDSAIGLLFIWLLLAIIGYIVIQFFYYKFVFRKENKKIIEAPVKNHTNHDYMCFFITGLLCFLIGLFSIYLWSKAYGGIFELILVGDEVRSGVSEVHNSMAFFKHPASIIAISSFIFLKLIKKNYKKFITIPLFILSLLFSVLYYFATDGRLYTAMYFVSLLLIGMDLVNRSKNILKTLLQLFAIVIIMLVFILLMDSITGSIRDENIAKTTNERMFDSFMMEFSYVIVSAQTATKQLVNTGSPILIFHDIFRGLFAWLPTALKPFDPISIWGYNTTLYHNSTVWSGTLPTDFVTTSIYNLSYFGIFIHAVFWALIIKKLDSKIKNNDSLFYEIAYYALFMAILRVVDYCMLYNFILSVFNVFVGFIIWEFVRFIFAKK